MKSFKIRSSAPYGAMFENFQKEVKTDSDKVSLVTFRISSAPRNDDDSPKLLPVDQFSGKDFMLNPSGFPMNDVMAFESVQSDSIARAVLARTQVLDMPKNQEMSPEDVFASIVPANWSSPAEYVRASKLYAQYAYEKQQILAQKAAEANKSVVKEPVKKDIPANPE